MEKIHRDITENEMVIIDRERCLYESAYPEFENQNMDDCEQVHLYANFTNWEPKRMIPFLNYIE